MKRRYYKRKRRPTGDLFILALVIALFCALVSDATRDNSATRQCAAACRAKLAEWLKALPLPDKIPIKKKKTPHEQETRGNSYSANHKTNWTSIILAPRHYFNSWICK